MAQRGMRKPQKVTIDADAFEDFVDEYFRKRVVSIEVLNTTDWRHPLLTDLKLVLDVV
jgi:hypothetical protein